MRKHLADKICALYELYGQRGTSASTRYRDLADIVRIVAAVPFEAARLATVLDREARRRRMILPNSLEAPSPEWATRFPAAAAGFAEYPRSYRDLTAALAFAGACLNDVLSASRASGRWNPMLRTWQPH
ncbi:nucleotidyl transferase AbiEii/AbiGii toxin family protein [Microlunatus sp. GCM10028923]|uniref:nucleotidyl transferase AbiEii/AbiGii toxin family protein n=1 Tax=Microlunatus sp. GCM10028923 TaxID=3273400 RepID=UPI003619095E